MDFGLDPNNSAITARLRENTPMLYLHCKSLPPNIIIEEEKVVGKSMNMDSGVESLFT